MDYPDARTAEAVCKALSPDNVGYVRTELQGNIIKFFLEAESAGTLKNTADDLLACIKVAEESSGLVVSGSAADLDSDAFLE